MKRPDRSVAAAMMSLAVGLAAPAFGQATDADGYADGYQSGAYGRVRAADGGATIVRAEGDAEDSDRATVNAPLFPGDTVRTDRDQRVEAQLASGTLVRIDRDAEVVFQSLPNPGAKYRDNSVVALNAGVLRLTLRAADEGEFRVDTPNASIYLLGDGEFRIDANDRRGTAVTSIRGVAEVVAGDASVLVRGGMRTTASAGSPPGTPTSQSAFSSDGFDRWCDARDDTYRVRDHDTARDADQRQNVPEEVRPYYQELSLQGNWTEVPDYGVVWYPTSMSTGWRPYVDGSWSYGPGGYFWVADEPWGWAPYHYGNWQWLPAHGWCWVPGRVFAGAWVSWSWGSSYVGWAPLDFWGRPGWHGGHVYNGYYDPDCWTFVNYRHLHSGSVRRYAVPIASVRDDLGRATVVARAPRIAPRRLAESAEWRERALQSVADDHSAHMRPIDADHRPALRLSDVQNHSMRRPSAPAQPVRRGTEPSTAPSIERRTIEPRPRRILEDPRSDTGHGSQPEAENGVRDLYQRMARPRETRGQDTPAPGYQAPTNGTRPSREAPERARPDVARPPPRAEAPRAQPPRPQAQRAVPPRDRGQPQARPRHGDRH